MINILSFAEIKKSKLAIQQHKVTLRKKQIDN